MGKISHWQFKAKIVPSRWTMLDRCTLLLDFITGDIVAVEELIIGIKQDKYNDSYLPSSTRTTSMLPTSSMLQQSRSESGGCS